MKSFILLLSYLTTGCSFYLNMNANTNWNNLQFSLKEQARKWFIDRAISTGIPWNDLYEKYDDVSEDIFTHKITKEDQTIEQKSYDENHYYMLGITNNNKEDREITPSTKQ